MSKFLEASGVQHLIDTLKNKMPSPASVKPKMDGTAAVGTSKNYAREDHVHPQDSDLATAIQLVAEEVGSSEINTSGNWTYVKRPDGVMICFGNISYTGKTAKAWGTWYYIDLGTFTYPATFVGTPTCVALPVKGFGGSVCFGGETNGTSAKTPGIYIVRPTTASNANGSVSLLAIGKWK